MLKTKRIRQTIEKQIKSHLKLVGIAKVKRNLQLKSKSKSKRKKHTRGKNNFKIFSVIKRKRKRHIKNFMLKKETHRHDIKSRHRFVVAGLNAAKKSKQIGGTGHIHTQKG